MLTTRSPVPVVDPARLVASLSYKPGWAFKVGGPLGRFLCVFATTVDSTRVDGATRTTQHMFEMPEGVEGRDFIRWVFDRLLDCERHEAGEFFTVAGSRPFYPNHQDGSPYEHVERWETTCL